MLCGIVVLLLVGLPACLVGFGYFGFVGLVWVCRVMVVSGLFVLCCNWLCCWLWCWLFIVYVCVLFVGLYWFLVCAFSSGAVGAIRFVVLVGVL